VELVIKERKMKDKSQALVSSAKPVKRQAAGRMALALTAALAVFAVAGPSWADDDDWSHGHKHHDQGWGYYGKHYPAYVYAPQPRYYALPPRVIYAPPPEYYYAPPPRVIYAPPPVYVYPQPGLQVVIPIQID